jgi:hypothetical protein
MTSTMLTRDESNQFWTRKGGLKGVPITLRVPTHVQLIIFDRHFLYKKPGDKKSTRIELKYPVRDFAQEFVYTEKIFTVDFKRPAAGLYNLNLNLTPDQYIQNFQHDVTEQTIQDVTTLIGKLIPADGGLAAVAASAPSENLEEIQSVVAVGMFEIDAPDFELQMSAFINRHLNQAHDAWVAPPDVRSFHRAHISGFVPQMGPNPRLVGAEDVPIGLAPGIPESNVPMPEALGQQRVYLPEHARSTAAQ